MYFIDTLPSFFEPSQAVIWSVVRSRTILSPRAGLICVLIIDFHAVIVLS